MNLVNLNTANIYRSAVTPKFSVGSRVTINYHSTSPYINHTGTVHKEAVRDAFRFCYPMRFEMNGYSTIVCFDEEELNAF